MRSDARKAMQEKRLAEQQVAASGGVDELARLVRGVVDRIERDGIDEETPGSPGWCHEYAERITAEIAREWLPERERAAREAFARELAGSLTDPSTLREPLTPWLSAPGPPDIKARAATGVVHNWLRERADREEQGR